MIIFSLECLADDSHRRHFIEPYEKKWVHEADYYGKEFSGQFGNHLFKKDGTLFDKPDLQAYNDACDKDEPIYPTMDIFHKFLDSDLSELQIWSGRCESTRDKTLEWLFDNTNYHWKENYDKILKMRPDDCQMCQDEIKERWLIETLNEGKPIDFVFDSDPDSIAMFRRKGIFVFDCNQGE